MRKELHHIENIERYLEGDLNAPDQHAFEQRLRQDADLRADVQLQRQLTQRINEDAFLADIAAQHQQFLAQEQRAAVRPSAWKPNWWLGGLLLLALGGTLGGLWWANTAPVVAESTTTAPTPTTVQGPFGIPTAAAVAPHQLAAAFQPAYQQQTLRAQRAHTLDLAGLDATLTIPADALVDAEGHPVQGTYELQYRALDHPADQAAAGLPLLYDGEAPQGLQSAALLDIRATQNGAPLYLADGRALSLDLQLPEREEGLTLYRLDEQTRAWNAEATALEFPAKGAYTEVLDQAAYEQALREYEIAVEQREKGITRSGRRLDVGTTVLRPSGIDQLPELEAPIKGNYLVRHYKNPRLVEDLRLPSFGVYNCARAYQVQHQVAIAARYTDPQRAVIDNASVLSVVDLDYGAAYSFEPSQFICNGKADNVFLVWTQDGRVYSFVKRATVDLQTGAYSFKMEPLYDRLARPEDLRQYLNFVQNKLRATPQK